VWGLLHGVAEVLTRRFRNFWDKLPGFLQWFVTFGFVSCAFLIFRADSLTQAYIMFRKVAKLESFAVTETLLESLTLPEIVHIETLLGIEGLLGGKYGLHLWISLAIIMFATLKAKNFQEKEFTYNWKTLVQTVGMLAWTIVSLSDISTFLYFNF